MSEVIKAPSEIPKSQDKIKIFLGGSIEMGVAEDWQTRYTNIMGQEDDVIILNPRRDDWDSSWVQDPTPGTKFHEQVEWELSAQDEADIIIYYFDDNTKSPITLLELGLYASEHLSVYNQGQKFVIVRCTPNFYRYGNVKIVCDRYGIPCVATDKEMFDIIGVET